MKKFVYVLLFLLPLAAAMGANARAATYHPEALEAVKDLAEAAKNEGKMPVAIFDLDDTLINTRERTFRIINDFINDNEVQRKFQPEVSALQNIKVSDIHFLLKDTLAGKGITNSDFVNAAQDFWNNSFFS